MTAELDLAARVVELVRAAAPDGEAEAFVDTTALALTRFANSMIHQNVADETTSVRLRLHRDGRTTALSTTRTGTEALDDLVARAVAATAVAPADPGWPGLAAPAGLDGDSTVDDAIVAATPADRAERVRAFVDGAGGLTTAGYCQTRHTRAAFANSAGQAVAGATTDASMDGIARTGTSDGSARLASAYLAGIDGAVLGARAAAKARAGTDPVELPPGRYEVVLEPTAVGDVLEALAVMGFGGKALYEKRSFLSPGTDQFDQSVSLVDDPVGTGAIGLPFDLEGTPRHAMELVTAGRTVTAVYDRRTAALAGTRSTGHAIGGPFGAIPVNLALVRSADGDSKRPAESDGSAETDGPAADASVAALVAKVGRGVLVTDHWYTRVLDTRTLVMTGLTRNGVWMIEDGEVTRPLRNFRFTQSYPRALAPGAVLGIGTHAVTLPSKWSLSGFRAPALHLASWNFTGGASG
jgi:predicted Zn-dependent protease